MNLGYRLKRVSFIIFYYLFSRRNPPKLMVKMTKMTKTDGENSKSGPTKM